MANVLQYTEDFNNGAWFKWGTIGVTTDTFAAPPMFGPNATLADTLTDSDVTDQVNIEQWVARGTPDSSLWTASVFIRKDTDTTRYPEIVIGFRFGTSQVFKSVILNTQTGAITDGVAGSPAASGVIDVDANWWRVWLRESDASDNTHVAIAVYPARDSSFSPSASSALTGTVIAWGANITKTSTVQDYDPHPSYQLPIAPTTLGSAGGWTTGSASIVAAVSDDDKTTYVTSGASTPDPVTLGMPSLDTPAGSVTIQINVRQGA